MARFRRLGALLFAAVLAAAAVSTAAQTPAADTLLAKAKYGTPAEIDGKLDSGWDNANTYTNENFVGNEENETDIEAEWKVMYDNAYLYFFVNVTDSTVGDAEYEYSEDGAYYAKNSIHLMFDLGYERNTFYDGNDFYIDISSQGYYNNHTADAFDYVTYATALTDEGYTAEIRVDFEYNPDFTAEAGTCIGFDLWANDNLPPLAGRIFARTWNDNSDSCWNNPSKMGTIQLDEKPANAAVTEKEKIERVIITYPNIEEETLPEIRPGEEIKDLGAVYSALTNMEAPQGGGSKDINVIIDGNLKNDGSQQYDTYNATPNDETGKIWYGIEFDKAYMVSSVVFVEGGHWGDGGWFGAAPTVQLLINGAWTDASAKMTPDYPGDSREEQGAVNEAYIFTLDSVTECTGVRVLGDYNTLAGHASCVELQAFGYTVDGYAAAEEVPAEEAVVEKTPVAEETVVEEPVEETVIETPAVTETVEETVTAAPQTFDMTIFAAAATVLLGVVSTILGKKRAR